LDEVRVPPFPTLAALLSPSLSLLGAEAPTNLRATTPLISGSVFEIAWEDNSGDEDAFEYEFSLDGETGWSRVGSARENQTLVSTITGGALDTTYYFRVRALSMAAGDSEWSNVASTSIPAAVPIWVRSGIAQGGIPGAPSRRQPCRPSESPPPISPPPTCRRA
jgi:hypothetical protein